MGSKVFYRFSVLRKFSVGIDAIKPFSACGFTASRILCPRDLISVFEMVRDGETQKPRQQRLCAMCPTKASFFVQLDEMNKITKKRLQSVFSCAIVYSQNTKTHF